MDEKETTNLDSNDDMLNHRVIINRNTESHQNVVDHYMNQLYGRCVRMLSDDD